MRRACLALALGCALLGAAAAARAQELGRLFFTPEQRAALEARRKARLPDKPTTPVIEAPVTRVDGYVQRSGGRSTVWVNGEPIRQGTQPEGTRVYPGADPSEVGISVGDSDRRFELRVGQSLERDTGTVKSMLGEGSIRVEKPASAPAPRQGPR